MMSKVEMTKADKNAIRRKIKRHKRVKKMKEKEKELIKSGLTNADYQVLQKNKSKIEKKIKDSRV